MKNKIKKLKEKSLLIYIFINLIYVLIVPYFVLNRYLKFVIFSYGYIVLLGINILIILILFFKKKYKKNKIDIFLILIIIFAIISTIFAYDSSKALFGSWDRYEGLFVICYYMSILFLTSFLKKEERKKIVYGILIFGFIQCIYAICQRFSLFNVYTKIRKNKIQITGFASNPNFFATLMVICLGYAIGLYFKSKDKLKSIIYLSLIYLYYSCLLFTKCQSCLVGLFSILIITFIFAIKNKNIIKFIVMFIVLLFSSIYLSYLNLSIIFEDLHVLTRQSTKVVTGNLDDKLGSGRIGIYKKTIQIVPKYIIHGVGVDNFGNVLDGKPIVNKELKLSYDKAHNEYLQILVTMGIFSLISYLCLHFIIIKNGIKNAFKNKEIYLILPVIGYLVQAQFNISVIEVAPIFYIGLGLLVDRNK